jgi:hypothetical protein
MVSRLMKTSSVCFASMFIHVKLINYNNNTKEMPYDYAMFCTLGSVEVKIAIVSGEQQSESVYYTVKLSRTN